MPPSCLTNYGPNILAAGIAVNSWPSVIAFGFGVKTPGHEVLKSVACITDNHPNPALVADLIRSKRIGQRCFNVWNPTRTKPRESSWPRSRSDIPIATMRGIYVPFSAESRSGDITPYND